MVGEKRRKMSEMASLVKNVLKFVREKGFGAFLRELKDEGYLFVHSLSFAFKFPLTNPFNILPIFSVFHFEFLLHYDKNDHMPMETFA